MAKARKTKKQIKPVSIIAIILCSCIVLYFVYSFIKLQTEFNDKQKELSNLVSVHESQVAENEALEEAVSEGDKDELAEIYARKKGYVMPDERVYVDITPGTEE